MLALSPSSSVEPRLKSCWWFILNSRNWAVIAVVMEQQWPPLLISFGAFNSQAVV